MLERVDADSCLLHCHLYALWRVGEFRLRIYRVSRDEGDNLAALHLDHVLPLFRGQVNLAFRDDALRNCFEIGCSEDFFERFVRGFVCL